MSRVTGACFMGPMLASPAGLRMNTDVCGDRFFLATPLLAPHIRVKCPVLHSSSERRRIRSLRNIPYLSVTLRTAPLVFTRLAAAQPLAKPDGPHTRQHHAHISARTSSYTRLPHHSPQGDGGPCCACISRGRSRARQHIQLLPRDGRCELPPPAYSRLKL